jgi:hypothetical protein
MPEAEALSAPAAYGWVALGVALSILLPVVVRAAAQALPSTTTGFVKLRDNERQSSALCFSYDRTYSSRCYLFLLQSSLSLSWNSTMKGPQSSGATPGTQHYRRFVAVRVDRQDE